MHLLVIQCRLIESKIDEDSSVDHCVLLHPQVQIGKNCTLKDCIIDRHCIIPDGMEIGVDKALVAVNASRV